MSCVVTGAAGFVGSHLAQRLIEKGHSVIGIDSFSDYYPRAAKLANISALRKNASFELVEGDLSSIDLSKLVKRASYVFHLAAQPGVGASWGSDFSKYVKDNILATQQLLEAMKEAELVRFIYASSSSVYGDSERLPTPEDAIALPNSPYGVTKLTAENLCRLYSSNFGVPIVTLRYFSVFGPRQRPDMAFHRFIDAISHGREIQIHGDGNQSRDFTFVDDVISATVLSMEARAGSVYNVGSGKTTTLRGAIDVIREAMGRDGRIVYVGKRRGDVRSTSADISRIRADLGYSPKTDLAAGLRRQISWQVRATEESR